MGDPNQWMHYTNQVATQFMQTSISPAGIQGQGYGGGNALSNSEDIVLRVFDMVDLSEVPRQPLYDQRSESGQTMLSLACAAGMHRVAAALLARGANPDVGDKGGYTALMHAALHSRSKTFQLLLVKGADPTLRSLKGYAATDLLTADDREPFFLILQNTQRSRSARPSLHLRHSFGSHTSSKKSWDISSASFYDSEVDASEQALSVPPSRRPSANVSLPAMPEEVSKPGEPTSSAAMIAWRDALATQIYQFQQSVHTSMSSFQLPTLPPLPDYHDNVMVRRLSSLVPGRHIPRIAPDASGAEDVQPPTQHPRFWDMFSSASPVTSVPPPAYSELFPDKTRTESDQATKRASVQTAVVDAVADEKCAMMFERSSMAGSSSTLVFEEAERPRKAASNIMPLWFWVSETEPMNSGDEQG